MKIIKIEPRRRMLTAVFLDGEIVSDKKVFDKNGTLLLDKNMFEEKFLKAGSEITESQVLSLIDESLERRAKSKAMWLISRRDYSKREMEKKLSADYGEAAAKVAANRLEELGYINDGEYAVRLAEQLIEVKKVSPKMAITMMTAKGIDRLLAEDTVLSREDDPRESIREIIRKKYLLKLEGDGKRKVFAALLRRGFSYSDVSSVLREFSDNFDEFGE